MTAPRDTPASAPDAPAQPSRGGGVLVAVAIVLAAANFRPAVTSVGPLLSDIRADLGLSGAGASILTALPVLCFGAGALVAPRLARRYGIERTLLVTFALTAVALLLRVGAATFALFSGTLVAGAAIAVANVLVPSLIKRDFSRRPGPMMGAYISMMMAMASLAAAVSVPLARALGGGWRTGLGAWFAPAAVAALVWLIVTLTRNRRSGPGNRAAQIRVSLVRDRVAWDVTTFMGLQALIFYAVMSWLPSIFRDHGLSAELAGNLLSLLLIVGVPAALFVSSLLARTRSQSVWALVLTAPMAAGLIGLLVAPTTFPHLWAVLFGLGTGTVFPLALTLVVLRTKHPADTAQLSAMSQSFGYALAALGPFLFGLLHDLSRTWTVPILALLVLLIPQVITGVRAGRPVWVSGRAVNADRPAERPPRGSP